MTARKYYSSISPKGQITLPMEIRMELGLTAKDRVAIEFTDGVVTVRPVQGIERYYQIIPALNPPRDWKEIEEIAHEDHALHVAREGLE